MSLIQITLVIFAGYLYVLNLLVLFKKGEHHQEEDSALEVVEMEMSKPQFKLIKYVNINNAFRFGIEYLDRYDGLQVYRKELLRQQKALYLYNKIRYNHMLEWWD